MHKIRQSPLVKSENRAEEKRGKRRMTKMKSNSMQRSNNFYEDLSTFTFHTGDNSTSDEVVFYVWN